MGKIKENSPLVLLLIAFLIVRLPLLWQIPLFEDETFHTQWGSSVAKNITDIKYPLSAGISPLFTLLTAIILKISTNQIVAGKIVSLASGFVIALTLFYFLKKVSTKNYLLMGLVFVLLPIVIIYTRLAILDTLMVMFMFLSFILAFLYLEKGQTKFLYFYFFSLTLALLTKQLAALIIPPLLIAAFFLPRNFSKLKNLFLTSFLALIILYLVFLPYKQESSAVLEDFIFIPSNVSDATLHFKRNTWLTINWIKAYYPLSLLVSATLGAIVVLARRTKDMVKSYAIISFVILSILIIFFDNLYFPRHTLALAPFVVISATIFIEWVRQKNRLFANILLLVVILQTVTFATRVITDPENSPILAKEDKFQFYQDWTSGKRLPEIANYLNRALIASRQPAILVDDSSTLYKEGLALYLKEPAKDRVKKISNADELENMIKISDRAYLLINRGFAKPFDITKYEKEEIIFKISDIHSVKLVKLK